MARRGVEWLGRGEANAIFAPGAVRGEVIVSDLLFENFGNSTIVRLEGCLNFQLDRTLNNPPTGSQVLAYHAGLIVAHKNLGTNDLDPEDDLELDWLWTCSGRVLLPVNYTWNGTTMILQDSPAVYTQVHKIDSRAMRRVRDSHELRLMVKPTIVTGDVDNLECTYNLRVLVKV